MDASLSNSEWEAIAFREDASPYDILCLWCIDQIATSRKLKYTAYLYFNGDLDGNGSALYDSDKDERWSELLAELHAEIARQRAVIEVLESCNP
jgi:hypothetical protein